MTELGLRSFRRRRAPFLVLDEHRCQADAALPHRNRALHDDELRVLRPPALLERAVRDVRALGRRITNGWEFRLPSPNDFEYAVRVAEQSYNRTK